MAYERLIYTNDRGDSVELSPYSIYHTNYKSDVTGASGINVDVQTLDVIGYAGGIYAGTRIGTRSITIKGYIKEVSRSVGGSYRRQLDRVFTPVGKGVLTYICDNVVRSIGCYVQNTIAWNEQKILPAYTIDLICPSPYWRDGGANQLVVLYGWAGLWTFPVDITAEDFEFSTVVTDSVDVVNQSDVECGMIVTFTADGGSVVGPYLENDSTGETVSIDYTIEDGDSIVLCTEFGNKSIRYISGDSITDIFAYADASQTVFPQLPVGLSEMSAGATSGDSYLSATISWQSAYLGV